MTFETSLNVYDDLSYTINDNNPLITFGNPIMLLLPCCVVSESKTQLYIHYKQHHP